MQNVADMDATFCINILLATTVRQVSLSLNHQVIQR